MKTDKGIVFCIDFFSNTLLQGWIYDEISQNFPEVVDLRSSCGVVRRMDASISINRPDVNKNLNITDDKKLGFNVNLKDMFNGIIESYEIYVNNIKLWSFNDSLQELDDLELAENSSLPLSLPIKNFGLKQIIVVYQKNGFLYNYLRKIDHWKMDDYFIRNRHSGIAFIFISNADITDIKNQLLREKNSQIIIIIERHNYKKVFDLSPSLIRKSTVIIIENQLNFFTDWNGMLLVLSSYTKMSNGEVLTASKLLRLLLSFSNNSDLFFDSTTNLYSYQSGLIEIWMQDVMRQKIQNKVKEDIVILTDKEIKRLAQVNHSDCGIFVRISSLRFLLDIVPLNSNAFVKEALRRGSCIRIVNKEEL